MTYDNWKLATPPEYEEDDEPLVCDLCGALNFPDEPQCRNCGAWFEEPCDCYGCVTMRHPCVKERAR